MEGPIVPKMVRGEDKIQTPLCNLSYKKKASALQQLALRAQGGTRTHTP